MMVADAFRTRPDVDQRLGQAAVLALSLSLVVNYPHFLFSYRLAYTRGRGFVLAHWWQLIAVPLALAGLLAAAYAFYQVPGRQPAVGGRGRRRAEPVRPERPGGVGAAIRRPAARHRRST